jgi:hypothetical protein
MKTLLISFVLTFYVVALIAQTPVPLVFIGENNRLQYSKYANTGQTEMLHQVPDFSWAGYKNGGVKLPQVPAVDTLTALTGDNTPQIQQAINAVSALSPDANGIRGAIFLKAGKYECFSPVYIKTSGVILRGEGQLPAANGGTQLVAMAKEQHNFINIEGIGSSAVKAAVYIDTIFVPQAKDTIDGKLWLSANVTVAVQSEMESDRVVSLRFEANNGDFSAYDSKEGEKKPYMNVLFGLNDTGKDTVITLYPTDDAFVQGGEYSADNFGTTPDLVIKNAGEGNRVTRIFYMKFELPEINAEAKRAELWLWCRNAGNTSVQEHYITLLSNDNWDEKTLTYNNQPYSGTQTQNSRIVSNIVPVGSYSVEVDNVGVLKVGDLVTVLRTPNNAWIDATGMAQYGWTADAYKVGYEKTITAIESGRIFFDIPIVQSIEKEFGGGEVFRIDNSGKTNNCGVENMFISSYYNGNEDEKHGWVAVRLSNTDNCWVKNVTAQYFGYGCVELFWAGRTTVEECAMLDPKSITTGSRKYSFHIEKGSSNLFQRCYTRGGRHDYVTGSRVAGPNVFVDCFAEQTFADIGPHHRYATGILFDNIKGGQTRVQNRKDMGSGHGWAGAQTMFWNTEAVGSDIKVESPFGAMNWGIGCVAPVKNGAGYWESWEKQVQPRSLYLKQLEDRLGDEAVKNVTSKEQREGSIWEILKLWKGIGSIQSGNAFLADRSIDGVSIPDFKTEKTFYEVKITADTIPNVSYITSDSLASTKQENASAVPGVTKIEVTAPNGITKLVYTINFTLTTDIAEQQIKGLKLFPNPVTEALTVKLNGFEKDKSYRIYSVDGKALNSGSINSVSTQIDVSSLSPGVYFFKIQNENARLKFIKQ